MSRILAIDYGLRRVGIAVTDVEQTVAMALTTVDNEIFLPFLEKYCQNEDVQTIVIGYPLDIDKDKDIVIAIDEMYELLKKMFVDKKIFKIDERYTSKIASYMINKYVAKKKSKRDKKDIDKISAMLILQSYMRMNNKIFD